MSLCGGHWVVTETGGEGRGGEEQTDEACD